MAISKKRKKKNAITLIVLLLLCVAIIVPIIILSQKKDKNMNEEETTTAQVSEKVFSVKEEDVTGVEYCVDGIKMTFARESTEAEWKLESDKSVPVIQSAVSSIIKNAVGLTVKNTYSESLEKAADFGIDDSSAWIVLKTAGGKTEKLIFGIKTPSSASDYYASLDGTQRIVAVSDAVISKLTTDTSAFAELTEFPVIDKTMLMEIAYKDKNQEVVLYNEPSDLSFEEAIGTTTWYFKRWGRYMATDYDEILEVLDAVVGIKFIKCDDFDATAEELKGYGLDEPFGTIGLKYNETTSDDKLIEKELVVLIGDKTEDESAYYISLEGDNKVYECAAANLDKLIEKNLNDSLMTLNPTLCNFDILKSIEVTSGDNSFLVEISQTKGKDEEGNDAIIYDCKLNGESYPEDDTRGLFIVLLKLTADHIIADEDVKEIENELFTCTYKTTAESRPEITFTVSDYDSIYYQLTVDGHSKYVISKQEYNTLINNLSIYWKNNENTEKT